MSRRRPLWLALAGGLGLLAGPVPGVQGQASLTQEEALALAFPAPARVERRSAFLTEEQLARARALAGEEAPLDQTVVTYYVGFQGDRPLGAAWFDAHRVRTLPEVLMVVLTPEGRVERVEVLRFAEPPEYRAPQGWLDQLRGRPLDGRLSVRGGVPNLTGATLTARAVTGAVRRALALQGVIDPFGASGERAAPAPGRHGGPRGAGP